MKNTIDLETPALGGAVSREVKRILVDNGLDFKITKLPLKAVYGAVNLKTDLFGLYNTKLKKVIATCKDDSNDGSTSLGVGVGEVVLSCQNQFYKFYKSTQSKMRHTASLEARVRELPKLIKTALEESMRLTETYKTFQRTKASKELVNNFVKEVYGISRGSSLDDQSKTTTKKLNNMNQLYEHIEKEMNQKGENLFGLFSGLTSFNTHKPQKFKREDGKINAMTHGENYRMNQKGLEFLTKSLVK